MIKPTNAKKDTFLSSIPIVSIESKADKLTIKCKFNFAYMDFSQPSGQSFDDWDKMKLSQLLNKLHAYCKESLFYWTTQRVGAKNNNVLEIYGDFPKKSAFKHPIHVPHEALWARFRLESSVRLVGFVLPSKYDQVKHPSTLRNFDCNTFYVVFLDEKHKFYLSK